MKSPETRPDIGILNYWVPGHVASWKRLPLLRPVSLASQKRNHIWRCLSFWQIILLGILNFTTTCHWVVKNSTHFITWGNKIEPQCPLRLQKTVKKRTPIPFQAGSQDKGNCQPTSDGSWASRWISSLPFPFCKLARKWHGQEHDSALEVKTPCEDESAECSFVPLLYKACDHTYPAVI